MTCSLGCLSKLSIFGCPTFSPLRIPFGFPPIELYPLAEGPNLSVAKAQVPTKPIKQRAPFRPLSFLTFKPYGMQKSFLFLNGLNADAVEP